MSRELTKTERRYEAMVMALPPERRLAMAGDMLASARKLVVAGMPPEVAADPRLLRRHLFLAFYQNDFSPEQLDKILAYIEKTT